MSLDRIVGMQYVPPDFTHDIPPRIQLYRQAFPGVQILESRLFEFYPYIIAEEGIEEFIKKNSMRLYKDTISLGGKGYNRKIRFQTYTAMIEAYKQIKDIVPELLAKDYDVIAQYQLESGQTMYKGLEFENLTRMQISIGTANDPEAILLKTGDDDIYCIGIKEARAKLIALIDYVQEKNPDLIELWDTQEIFLPLLALQNQADFSEINLGRSNLDIYYGEPYKDNKKYKHAFHGAFVDIPGREVIDLRISFTRLNEIQKLFRSINYKDLVDYLGISKGEEPQQVQEISPYVTTALFEIAKIFPVRIQEIPRKGTAELINIGMASKHLSHINNDRKTIGYALPFPAYSEGTFGPLIQVYKENTILENIYRFDGKSWYPSHMLQYKIKPRTDELDKFLPLLKQVLDERNGKKDTRDSFCKYSESWVKWDIVQAWLKTLASTFYGYMGAGYNYQYYFSDREKAGEVVQRGKESMLQLHDLIVHNLKTNFLWFAAVMTDSWHVQTKRPLTEQEKSALVKKINDSLPEKLNVDIDGPWTAVYFANNNYALYRRDTQELVLKGEALHGRNLPKFIIELNESLVKLFLSQRDETYLVALREIYRETKKKLLNVGKLPSEKGLGLEDIILEGTFEIKLEDYKTQDIRLPQMEALERSPDIIQKSLKQGDIIKFYAAENESGTKLKNIAEVIFNFPKIPVNFDYYIELMQKKFKYILKDVSDGNFKFIFEEN